MESSRTYSPHTNEIEQDLLPYFKLTDPSLLETIRFEGSRIFTEIMTSFEWANWKRWNKVAPNLYLGKLPSFNQCKQIYDQISQEGKLGLVVSAIGYSELAGYKVDPPSYWKEKHINQHILLMPDFTADASNDSIIEAVLAMKAAIDKGESVYVHCKAGRSRSAMLCAIYLYLEKSVPGLSYNENDIQDDLNRIEGYLKKARPQVGLLDSQRTKAAEVIQIMKKMELNHFKAEELSGSKHKSQFTCHHNETTDLKEALKNILSSTFFKYQIVHFSSFMNMAYYAFSNQVAALTKLISGESEQTKNIKTFFMSIYDANNEDWFLDLISSQGPLEKLANMDTYSLYLWKNEEDKKEREKLRVNLINEIVAYLAEILKCKVEDLKEAALELISSRELAKPLI